MNIGLKIKELADKKNLPLTDFAKALGKSKQAIYEMVEKEDVNTQILKQLSSTYDVPITYFFGGGTEDVRKIQEKLDSLESENRRLRNEVQRLKNGKKTPAKVLVELDVDDEEFIKLGLKDKVIQILSR